MSVGSRLYSVYNRTLANQMSHSERWGYETFVLRRPVLDLHLSKPAYLLQIMLSELEKPGEERLEWL